MRRRGGFQATVAVAMAVMAFAGGAHAQTPGAQAATKHRELIVSLSDRRMAVMEEGHVVKLYVVAVGASISPSPEGDFGIVNRVENPTYYHPGKVIGPGTLNPLGTRWMGLSKAGFGIHGTNQPESIGKAASHGCIRMKQQDLEELFVMLRVGDQVHIHGQRDAQVVTIFSNQQQMQMAEAQQQDDAEDADAAAAQ